MALTASPLTPDSANTAWVASFRLSHHADGSCSAQPALTAFISISFFGKKAEALQTPLSASTNAAFTDELPMSYPNKYIILFVFSFMLQ